MISSGLNFCKRGRITFSNAARNLALPSSGASGALTMVSCSPRSPRAPVPGNSGIWWVEQYITLGSDHGGIVEKAKAHRFVGFGVMARRPHRDEGIVLSARHHRVGGGNRAADAAHRRFPGARRHRGVGVHMDQAACRSDVPEFTDVMLVVAERDRIQRAFRRLAAHQPVEAIFRQHLIDGTQPVGSFGMPGRREMVETGRMGENKRRHSMPWRAERAFREAANLGGRRPLRKSRKPRLVHDCFELNRRGCLVRAPRGSSTGSAVRC